MVRFTFQKKKLYYISCVDKFLKKKNHSRIKSIYLDFRQTTTTIPLENCYIAKLKIMKRSMTFVFTPFSHNLKMYVENSNRDKPCLTFTGLRSPVKYLFILYYIQYILKWFSTTKNFFYLLPFSKASALAYMNPESK